MTHPELDDDILMLVSCDNERRTILSIIQVGHRHLAGQH